MTPLKIINELLKRESKRKSVNKAQMTEIVGHLADMVYEHAVELDANLWHSLTMLGKKRKAKASKR